MNIVQEDPSLLGVMALNAVDEVYKALRLLPDFDGNVNVLTRFIRLCDQLVNEYANDDPAFALTNLALLNGILNKITGPAARLINSNGIPESWIGIRNALINTFADQRDETSLYNDLALLNQGSSSPQEFYEKCLNLFSTIMTYVSLHETIPSIIESKRSLYKKLTLQSYMRGLRDPMGSRIRCMRPDTMEKALEFVHEEENTMYLQQRNGYGRGPVSEPKNNLGISPPLGFPPRPQFSMQGRPFNMPGPSQPMSVQPLRPVPAYRFPMQQMREPTRTQQMFGAPPPNYRPQSNVFKSAPQNTLTGPQPMSGVSHYVAKQHPGPRQLHDWSKFGNPQPSNYFKTREAHFNELYEQPTYDNPQTEYYDHCTEYYYPDLAHEYEQYEPFYSDDYDVKNTQPLEVSKTFHEEDFQKPPASEKPR